MIRMRYRDILSEMPELIDATDFNLMEPAVNRELTKKLMDRSKTIIEETSETLLFRTGKQNGNIALLAKADNRIDYWIRYETMNKALTGQTVTQVRLWRNSASRFVAGLTTRVFFDYLLREWNAVMSDAQQTPAGQDFWRRQIVEASERELRVGLANLLENKVLWWEGNDITKWITDNMTAWGSKNRHQGYRFIIANQKAG